MGVRYNIPVRLAALRMKQVELLPVLRGTGLRVQQSDLSSAINGVCNTEKADRICKEIDAYLTNIEKERGMK